MKRLLIMIVVSSSLLSGTAVGTTPPNLGLAVSVDGRTWNEACFVRGEPRQARNCHRFRPWRISREKTLNIRTDAPAGEIAARWYVRGESRRNLTVRAVGKVPTQFWVLTLPRTSGKLVFDKSTQLGRSTWQVTVKRGR